MKFVSDRPFADPGAAARKLIEIANATEEVQDGRIIYIEIINAAFRDVGLNCDNADLVVTVLPDFGPGVSLELLL